MSHGLWLLLEEPQPVWPEFRRPPPDPGAAEIVSVVESLWPATAERIAHHLGVPLLEAKNRLAGAMESGLLSKNSDNYHATDAGRALLSTL